MELTKEQQSLFDELAPLCQKTCLNVIKGMSNIDAYEAAGGKGKTQSAKEVSVSRMLSNVKAKAFLGAMNEAAITEAVMTKQEMLERLSNLSRINMSDLINFATVASTGDDGESIQQSTWQFKDSALQDDLAMASIAEVAATKEGFKIKQHSPLAAMKQLSELAGYNAPTETNVNLTSADKWADE